MRAKTIAKVSAGLVGWLAFLFFAGLIVVNSLGYLTDLKSMEFLEEKGAVALQTAWRGALVLHVAAGLICLGASVLQFFRGITRRWPGLHRWLGRVYAWSVLWVLCPSGAYLALWANGGLGGQSGFLLLGGLTFWTTWRGVREMTAGRPRHHARWMIRSFAMVTTAITFRIYHVAFGYTAMSAEANYVTALWLSIAGNALAAEWFVRLIPLSVTSKKTETHHETKLPAPVLSGAGAP